MKNLKRILIFLIIELILITMSVNCYAYISKDFQDKLSEKAIGIGGGGMLHSPVISNFDPNTMMVAADMGGIYVSNDAGKSWDRKNLKGTVMTTYADPVREGVLYAGGSGLWRSTDNGKTFKMIFPREDDIIERINMNENGIHYIFTKSKLYPYNKYIKDILVNPNDGNNIFALSYYGKEGKVFESKDNGENFELLFTFNQTRADINGFYELTKLLYKKETNELFCISDEEILKYDRAKNETVSIYKSELGIIKAISVFEDGKTQFIIIENTNNSDEYATKVYYTNDFESKIDITDKIINGLERTFTYNNKEVSYKWKFNHIAATSLNNIYITHVSNAEGYPWPTSAVLRFDGEKSVYRYGLPFKNHMNLKLKGWADGSLASYGIAVTPQRPEICLQSTLIGVNLFENDTDIYQRYTTNVNNGKAFKTSGINEQTTYGVELDPFDENHMLLLNTDLGLISSNDKGETWIRTNSGIPSAWINTIYDAEFDKNNKNVVYSIWGGRHDAPYAPGNETENVNVHGGFAISTDGGKTWNSKYSSGIPENTTPVKMAVVYGKGEEVTIYVATFKDGFFISTDSGKTFNSLNNGIEKVAYKDDAKYEYILAADIEVKDGRVFGITAKNNYSIGTQKGEVFELIDNKWEKIEMPQNHTTPRDVYYHNGVLYISSTAKPVWDYKDGRYFSNYCGGVFTYKDGKVEQIFDESISTTGVQIDSQGNMYVSDMNGNIYRKAYDSEEYQKIYDSYHSISKGIQLTDDDTIYLAAFGGGVLKLEGLENLKTKKYEKGDISQDGKVDVNDLAKLKLYIIDENKLTGEALELADLDEDGKVTINDLAKLKIKLIDLVEDEEPEIAVEDTSFKDFNFNQMTAEDTKVSFSRLNFQNAKQKEYGIKGAGSQWPISLETSSTGDLMLYGIDVAGLYKSTDHGKTWTLACNGFGSRGIGMSAIDPHNSNHVLAVGLGNGKCGGVYVSYDKAETWAKYSDQSFSYHGARYIWDGLEFDPTSYNEDKNLTLDAYYSIPYKRDSEIRTSTETPSKSYTSLKENEVGLYKSTDGGKTFELIINDKKVADGIVRITENGDVYVGNQYGLFLIDKENNRIKASYLENDGEKNFAKGVTGLDVAKNTIYAQTWDGIYTLNGENLTKITNENYKSENWPQFLTVSKSNPNHMIYQYRSSVTNYYVNHTEVSFDGGKTWKYGNADLNTTFYKSSWVGREKTYIIDPSDDNNVITFGSDTIMRSEDGGLNFVQASGVSNMMQGGKFNFNYYDSDLILFSAQDYTGVVTIDGGKTYERFNITGGKGNFYGGFAADRDTYFGFANTSWGGGTLSYTHDGGDTWTDTGLEATGVPECRNYSSLQSPTNPNVLFAVEYYSKDKGYTWNKMNGCTSVFTYNYTGKKELYGGNADGKVVVSYDNGDTWKIVCDKPWNSSSNVIKQTILDLAYDHVNNYIYAVVQVIIKGEGNAQYTNEAIYKLNVDKGEFKKLNIPVDTDRGYMRQNSIAIDPNATSVIYVGGFGGYFSAATALIRSVDGGETWKILTSNNTEKYPSFNNNQGGYEVTCVRVNPYDGKVWIACGCYGYETFDPPYDASKLNHEKPQEHTIKYVYNGKVVNEVKVRNNEEHKYIYDEDGLTFVDWYKDKEFKNNFPNGSRVYNSMVLYAKMKESTKVEFYDRENLLWKIDLDAYDLGDEKQIPTREGYAFAGWYKDAELSELADFSNIKEDAKVYAGWYKIVEDIFDINAKDIGNYIAYDNDHRIQDGKEVENNAEVDNRCVYTSIDKNSTYYISFKMDTRCRIGLGTYAFWQYNPVKEYFIDEDDNNGKTPANKYVFKTISSGEHDKMLVYYYTESGSKEYMDIKNTFKIYKIENTNVKENNIAD